MPRDIAEKFNVELSKQIDPIIDFTGVNVALIVFPLKTNTLVKEQIGFGTLKSNESTVWASIMSGNQLGSGGNFALPMWWIHELNHLAIGFGDSVHDEIDSPAWWGINNWASAMDELVWYKWLVGFVSDNQINCLNSSNSSTVWVTPSTIKGSTIKAAVVPLSPTKVIVIESQRAQGINYKLPEISEGALIYFVDLNMVNPHDGIRLILPKNKIMITGDSMNPKYPGINANAVLKLNEYSEHAGYRFTVIESGDFGDVIKVEKL